MDPVTHVAAGVLISQMMPGPSRGWSALAGTAFALLPDIDYFMIFTDRLSFIRDHRSFTHSLVALVLFALLGAGLGRALGGPRWFRPIFFLGLAVLASHLLLDLATSYGTQILFPFSRQRFTLDWLFIIDPYLTALLLAGAVISLRSAAWSRPVGAVFLAAAGVYFLLCGLYHQQALALAREVFQQPAVATPAASPKHLHTLTLPGQALAPEPEPLTVAALPQPFSPRRWQLIAANNGEVEQSFVQLPYLAFLSLGSRPAAPPAPRLAVQAGCRVPDGAYRPPAEMHVQVWTGPPAPDLSGHPEARKILEQYLEFARFPLLRRVEPRGDGELLEWLDLRFSVPGRDFPFVLQLQLDAAGRVQHWRLGRCGDGS
jgi:inner membrane protein